MNKSEIAPNFIEFTIPGHMNNYKNDEHFESKVPRVGALIIRRSYLV